LLNHKVISKEVVMTLSRYLFEAGRSVYVWRRLWFILLLLFVSWTIAPADEQMKIRHVNQKDCYREEAVRLLHDGPNSKSPDLLQAPGWPQVIAVSGGWTENKGVILADLDEDGNLEIITGTSGYKVYVWDYRGNHLPGWPQWVAGRVLWGIAVGDVDGDGLLEIVANTSTPSPKVYVFDRNGNVLTGWPVSFDDHTIDVCPTLSDLDEDGRLEIIVSERVDPIGYVHVLRYDGTEFPGDWPVGLDSPPATSAAVGDIDNDGQKEIIFCSVSSVFAFESDGTIMPGWPHTPNGCEFYRNGPALADFYEDGYLQVVCSSVSLGGASECFILDRWGDLLPGWPRSSPGSLTPPSVGDIDQDGQLEIVVGNYPSSYPGPVLSAFDAEGNLVPGFPVSRYGGPTGSISIADIVADSTMELIFDNNVTVDSIGFLWSAYSHGDSLPDWPLRPFGVTYYNGSTIGDVNDDGILEVCAKTKFFEYGRVNLWSLLKSYGKTRIEWGTYQSDNHRTGLHHRRSSNQQPQSFSLISPDSGVAASLKPTLFWNKTTNPDTIGGPVTYTLKYSLNPLFWGHEQIEGLTGTVCTLSGLMPDSVYYWRVKADDGAPDGVTWADRGFWWFRAATYVFGDANGDQTVDPGDIVYLINYLFRDGDPPDPLLLGDPSNDCVVDAADVIYLINCLFRGGPAPLQGCA
jgi:hypothetical protein